jgi:hypothetical protein
MTDASSGNPVKNSVLTKSDIFNSPLIYNVSVAVNHGCCHAS